MAGIYIHIPFCRSRCIYCGFYSTTHLELRQRYVEAVCKEIIIRNEELEIGNDDHTIKTIYLGGGTPSQLTIPQLHQILDALYKYKKVSADAEITIEVNPDDVSVEYVAALQQLPINRVSMGTQTFNDERLQWLHRRHTSKQVTKAVSLLRDADIQNISVDLMYGFPGQQLSDWETDIKAALNLDVEHISAYCLTIEEGTPLARIMGTGCLIPGQSPDQEPVPMILPDEETERSMYELLIDRLTSAGYEHYEISNFARPGFRSRHNSGYWDGTPYIGIGAAAHSYDGLTRSWNIADIRQYTESMENGKRLFDYETIEGDTRYNDLLTVTLRTSEGLDLSTLSDRHHDYVIKNARRFLNDGLLHITPDNHLALTRSGLFVSDMIIRELMLV